ncbi:MAG: efflux RND transporter periplasmic adaptor subunit [Kofleriaceae bacterium]|jgi:RND family efflux transporter MFP subunit|nr:efflux RND transporter periplasmic adaptor subunit [Kofleriaceae bacterium]MBP9170100.1 efflux RND transporter periplasmic adaptor subunit [Kofleriaceae bacterium]MBP9859950.1 efflux RND transporter periplasmic adaptor subunit [Kofleriaceae bacterium]
MLTRASLIPLVLGLVAAACGRDDGGKPVGEDPFAAQREVKPAAAPAPLVLTGVVTSAKSEVVVAEFDAKVDQVLVTGGQRVTAGQPLARLDDSQLQQRLEGARQRVNSARAEAARASIQAADARRQLATEQKLYRSGAQSRQAVTSAQAALGAAGAAAASASSSAKSAYAEVAEFEAQLGKAEIRAPMDGVVTMIKVKPGEMAQRGTRIARVFDPSDLQVRFEVPRGHRADFAVGTAVLVELDGVAQPVPAKVIDLSADLEAPLQFAVATADLDDRGLPADDGRVGAVAKVRLATPPAPPSAPAPAPPAAPATP